MARRILRYFQSIQESYCKLEQIAALSGFPYHQVIYEELVDSPNAVMTQLTGALLGRTLSPLLEEIRISVQRDSLNQEFRARLLADIPDLQWESYA